MDQKCKFPIIVFIISFFFLVHHRLSLSLSLSLSPQIPALRSLPLSLSLSQSLFRPQNQTPPKQVTVTKNKPLSLSLPRLFGYYDPAPALHCN